MPKLQSVTYCLFESEVGIIEDVERGQAHSIDREIRLQWNDGKASYISWDNIPALFCVAISDHSFFVEDDVHEQDVSSTPLWRSLVGQTIKCVFLDVDHQVLVLKVDEYQLYIASREGDYWYSDTLLITPNTLTMSSSATKIVDTTQNSVNLMIIR